MVGSMECYVTTSHRYRVANQSPRPKSEYSGFFNNKAIYNTIYFVMFVIILMNKNVNIKL